MAQRRSGNSHTTISITWEDKDEFRRYAQVVKNTKNGSMTESDAVLFQRVLAIFKENTKEPAIEKGLPTYPNKISLDDNQPNSEIVEPIEQ